MADVAAYTGDQGFIDAMDRLWQDVVQRKMYITGGIGARHEGEAFGDAYELPNDSAYCETCAAIGLAFWAHRLNLLHGDAQYADVLERALYNGVLSGIALDGEHFFYVNPLASRRQAPSPAVLRLRLLPDERRAVRAVACRAMCTPQSDERIYVNLYAAGTAQRAAGRRRRSS